MPAIHLLTIQQPSMTRMTGYDSMGAAVITIIKNVCQFKAVRFFNR